MQPIVRSLQAAYAGYAFRSWTEARHAMHWDLLGIQWTSEPGALYHSSEGAYLCDFLVQFGGLGPAWVEIKPYLSIAGDDAPFTAEVQRTIRIMTTLCEQPSDVSDGQPIPGVIFGGDPGPDSQALIVYPMRPYPKILECAMGICPFCGSICLLAEYPPHSKQYAVMCRCLRIDPHYRLSPIERRRATHDPRLVDAARIARSFRFETPATAAQLDATPGRRRLTVADVKIARSRFANGETVAQIAKSYAVVESTISRAVHGITWKGVT